jgi:hypothetical protein
LASSSRQRYLCMQTSQDLESRLKPLPLQSVFPILYRQFVVASWEAAHFPASPAEAALIFSHSPSLTLHFNQPAALRGRRSLTIQRGIKGGSRAINLRVKLISASIDMRRSSTCALRQRLRPSGQMMSISVVLSHRHPYCTD